MLLIPITANKTKTRLLLPGVPRRTPLQSHHDLPPKKTPVFFISF
jgi:hypothetical protein